MKIFVIFILLIFPALPNPSRNIPNHFCLLFFLLLIFSSWDRCLTNSLAPGKIPSNVSTLSKFDHGPLSIKAVAALLKIKSLLGRNYIFDGLLQVADSQAI
ncbi:hypothetical protein BSKO_09647 [Bryopsis sp. KO-2023]|nr:hypothetical protein BSKO_09647 [Bryopsis sp. KO-2023]